MSGFVGYTGAKGNNLKKMSDVIKHRGKKTSNFSDGFLNVEYRASTTNKEHFNLPFTYKDLILMYDGLIYNKEEIEALLEEKVSLSEGILKLYMKYEESFLKFLKGNFSIMIYNTKKKEVFLARDFFGVKPLYFSVVDKEIIFASESKAILEYEGYKKELNEEVLKSYLEFSFTPTKETFFKGIYRLDAGSYLIFKNEKEKEVKYFTPHFTEDAIDYNFAKKTLEKVLNKTISAYNTAEAASFLSSGVDSSYIVSVLKPQRTYTVIYDNKNYDEGELSRSLTNKLNIENIQKKVSKTEFLKSVEKAMYHLDDPSGDPAIISLLLASEIAKEKDDVVFSGEGADEFFGGYNVYNEEYSFNFYNKIPFFIRKTISSAVKLFPEVRGINFLTRRGERLEDYYIGVNRIFSEKEAKKVLNKNSYIKSTSLTKEVYKNTSKNTKLAKMQSIDINFWLAKDILLKADKMTAAHSLDVRSPFVDIEVFNAAKVLKPEHKISKLETKIIFREIAKKVIPNDSYKKKKLGFPVPIRDWLREEDFYQEVYNEFTGSRAKLFFNTDNILKLLNDHFNEKKDNYKKIWTIYAFLKWYQVYFN